MDVIPGPEAFLPSALGSCAVRGGGLWWRGQRADWKSGLNYTPSSSGSLREFRIGSREEPSVLNPKSFKRIWLLPKWNKRSRISRDSLSCDLTRRRFLGKFTGPSAHLWLESEVSRTIPSPILSNTPPPRSWSSTLLRPVSLVAALRSGRRQIRLTSCLRPSPVPNGPLEQFSGCRVPSLRRPPPTSLTRLGTPRPPSGQEKLPLLTSP